VRHAKQNKSNMIDICIRYDILKSGVSLGLKFGNRSNQGERND